MVAMPLEMVKDLFTDDKTGVQRITQDKIGDCDDDKIGNWEFLHEESIQKDLIVDDKVETEGVAHKKTVKEDTNMMVIENATHKGRVQVSMTKNEIEI